MKNNTFTVQRIVNKRRIQKGEVEYQVKWLGYESDSDLTWEPMSHLNNCAELIEEYQKSTRHNTAIRTEPKSDNSNKNLKRPRPNSISMSREKRTPVRQSDPNDGNEIYEEESNDNAEDEYVSKPIKKQTAIRSSSKAAAPEPAKKPRVFRKAVPSITAMEQEENQEENNVQQNLNQLCTGNKGKYEVQAIIRDKENKNSYLFKVKLGKQEKTMPKDELVEEDPYSLLYYYEKNIQFIANK